MKGGGGERGLEINPQQGSTPDYAACRKRIHNYTLQIFSILSRNSILSSTHTNSYRYSVLLLIMLSVQHFLFLGGIA